MPDAESPPAGGLRYVVSATEIADLFGATSPSTVSNWRARHADFPMPLMRGHNAPFELDEVLAWARRPDTPARLEVGPSAEWWWGKTVDAVRAVVDVSRATAAVNPLRGHLAAVVLLRAALVGDVPGVRASARRWTSLLSSRDPRGAVSEEAGRLEVAHAALRGLLVGPLGAIHVPTPAMDEVLRRLDAAGTAGVSSRRLLEVVLEHVSPAVHPRQVATTTGEELATIVAGLAGATAGDVIYDPCVGEGGLVLACARSAAGEITAFAQELDVDASRIARSRFLVEPLTADVGRPGLDTLGEDQFTGRKANVVVADPPVAVRASLSRWVDHVLDHLTNDGRGVIAIPAYTVTLSKESRRLPDEELRHQLVRLAGDGHVAQVVVLTHHVRRDVPGPMTVWVLERTPRHGRRVQLRSARPRRDGEIQEPLPTMVQPGDLLDAIGRMALELGTGRKRPSAVLAGEDRRERSTGRARAEVQRKLATIESELNSLVARVAPDDPDAAIRVRQAIDELHESLDSLD